MKHICRFALAFPLAFPFLALATLLDFLFFPHYRTLGCDPAEKVANIGMRLLGVSKVG